VDRDSQVIYRHAGTHIQLILQFYSNYKNILHQWNYTKLVTDDIATNPNHYITYTQYCNRQGTFLRNKGLSQYLF